MLALTLAMLLWSSAFISLKYLLDYFSSDTDCIYSYADCQRLFLLFGKKLLQFRYEAGDWRWLVVMGIAEPCLYFYLKHRHCNTPRLDKRA